MAQTIVAGPHVGRESGTQSQLAGAHAWWVWILSVAFVVFLFSVQTGYAIVSGNVQKDVGLSVTQVATIAATYTWVFALFQFYGGALLDQLGSRKVLPISIALVVLDMKSTPIIDYRMQFVEDIHEALFVQMTLGDDRAIESTYVAGALAYSRPEYVRAAA